MAPQEVLDTFVQSGLTAQLGYPVFAPSSFARPGRTRSCGQADSVMNWRLEEIRIALANLKTMTWIDQNRLVLAGFSELFAPKRPKNTIKKPKKPSATQAMLTRKAKKNTAASAKAEAWTIYHHFKKHHDMLNW